MTETHDCHGYPLHGFFVAHKRFTGPNFKRGGEWGDILDGPQVDDEAVIEAITDAWSEREFLPYRGNLRVWYIVPGKPARDVTEWAACAVDEALGLQGEGL